MAPKSKLETSFYHRKGERLHKDKTEMQIYTISLKTLLQSSSLEQ